MRITEGISSMWHYHLSRDDKFTEGLCGAKTMQTSMNLDQWGIPFGEHFPKKPTWCKECGDRAKKEVGT